MTTMPVVQEHLSAEAILDALRQQKATLEQELADMLREKEGLMADYVLNAAQVRDLNRRIAAVRDDLADLDAAVSLAEDKQRDEAAEAKYQRDRAALMDLLGVLGKESAKIERLRTLLANAASVAAEIMSIRKGEGYYLGVKLGIGIGPGAIDDALIAAEFARVYPGLLPLLNRPVLYLHLVPLLGSVGGMIQDHLRFPDSDVLEARRFTGDEIQRILRLHADDQPELVTPPAPTSPVENAEVVADDPRALSPDDDAAIKAEVEIILASKGPFDNPADERWQRDYETRRIREERKKARA